MKLKGEYIADATEGFDALLMARVVWQDPNTTLGWTEISETALKDFKGVTCHSLGYLLLQNSEKIVLAGSVQIEGGKMIANEVQTYPMGCVESLSILKKDH